MKLYSHIRTNIIQGKTPFYHYDLDLLHRTLKIVKEESNKHDYHVHYAMKANSNSEILHLISSYGLGLDCVSGNEVSKGINSGFGTKKIAFAGVGKTDEEIALAIEKDIFSINCESIEEVVVVNEIASEMDKKANIAIRLNPNIDAKTHQYITTGKEENKFGIGIDDLPRLLNHIEKLHFVKLVGIHFHIGSQILDFQPFEKLCEVVNYTYNWLTNNDINIEHINLGGGLGVDYQNPNDSSIPDFKTYFSIFAERLKTPKHVKIHFELGRSIVAHCGSLVTKVLFKKQGKTKRFLIVDAGMTELLRPALYGAFHKIESLSEVEEHENYDVVGPICESSDCFGQNVHLPKSDRGDFLVIRSVGAYGEVMALNYNMKGERQSYYSL